MKSSLRVVFMGTPEFAAHQLKEIAISKHEIVGVVTTPDKPAGRGRKMHESAVKTAALELSLPLAQPEKLKATEFLTTLEGWKPDVIVVVAFRMLPKVVWEMPSLGTFNLHASLLPNYRGAAPINWAIMNGEVETGLTTFIIDEHIDTGNILLQKSLPISPTDSASTLHDRMKVMGGPLIVATLDAIASKTIQPRPQDANAERKEAPKIFRETCEISWEKSAQEVIDHIRGLSSYPAATAHLETEEGIIGPVKIFKTQAAPIPIDLLIGEVVINGKHLWVGTGKGAVQLEKLQLPGKKPVDAVSFINGSRFTTMKFI